MKHQTPFVMVCSSNWYAFNNKLAFLSRNHFSAFSSQPLYSTRACKHNTWIHLVDPKHSQTNAKTSQHVPFVPENFFKNMILSRFFQNVLLLKKCVFDPSSLRFNGFFVGFSPGKNHPPLTEPLARSKVQLGRWTLRGHGVLPCFSMSIHHCMLVIWWNGSSKTWSDEYLGVK